MIELTFSTNRRYTPNPELVDLLGADQALKSTASQTEADPDEVEVRTTSNTVTIRFKGVSLSEATKTSVDAWSDSVTSNLPDAVETKRQDIKEGT